MHPDKVNDIRIENTTADDWNDILWFFEKAMEQHGKKGYKVWEDFDRNRLKKDMENILQYKIMKHTVNLCFFSIQYSDPLIWREKDQHDALYLHRMVANPNFKGQKQFQKVVSWAKQFARTKKLRLLRMDTWADNTRIIDYYKSFGFEFIENYQTTNATELPIQNRNLNLALLELNLDGKLNDKI